METEDQNVIKVARGLLGNVETVTTKDPRGFNALKSLLPYLIRREIKLP